MLCDIIYVWNLKYSTNEPIYKTKADLQPQTTDLWLPSRERVGEGWSGSLGLANVNNYIYRMDKQQSRSVQHRALQSASCDRPQWKKLSIYLLIYRDISLYIYLYIYNFAVQQKIKRCKSTILQFKMKKNYRSSRRGAVVNESDQEP